MYHFFRNFQAKILTKTKIAAKTMTDGKIENVKNTMTLRHLFTMTAGLTYNVES
jgi:hypothetical protein